MKISQTDLIVVFGAESGRAGFGWVTAKAAISARPSNLRLTDGSDSGPISGVQPVSVIRSSSTVLKDMVPLL